jgi:hypothetical protein
LPVTAPPSGGAEIENQKSEFENNLVLAPSAAAPRCDQIADREPLKQKHYASQ